MKREELIDYTVQYNIKQLLKEEVNVAISELVQSKLDMDEDRISVYLKKEYIKDRLNLRIAGIVSLLTIGDFDEVLSIARDKINLKSALRQLDKEVEFKVEEEGLESIIPNFSL